MLLFSVYNIERGVAIYLSTKGEDAAITGYDISVISRSTANKYISTPWGTLPLRFFFSEGVGEGVDEASAREIQAAIKQIIENEDKRRPLSDDLICRKLNEKGYDIRRRTVAKYRDRLGIPVARLRRTSQYPPKTHNQPKTTTLPTP